ncbi:MAG TPA: 50S ribosomal protein L4 [Thiobacillus sp.]|nr:MAG: 50S ribosomal protein L4 [Hydrogenophilales bacterium 16-61-112]OZA45707.1 MAG: 50S ribosomal protein L4 [Hydrogenophilales bacterium 17-61-76]HQT31948.1 50S ribosomal protein L4 [Thiobacillus sp.]HQT71462.1 50S ribosomal protein L4 [Thiobacillus sp.]
MELTVINEQGQQVSTLAAADDTFGRDYNEALIHQVVTAFQANARSGNRAQQTRAEVTASTHKPWRQKGTGRARAGRTSSPIWRGGGLAFPNKPNENFSHKVNRKMYRAGLAAILSQLVREGKLKVVESLGVDSPKTKLLAVKLKSMGFGKVMIIADSVDENLWLSSRNLPNVYVVEPHQADPWSLVKFGNVLITKAAIKQFEEMV